MNPSNLRSQWRSFDQSSSANVRYQNRHRLLLPPFLNPLLPLPPLLLLLPPLLLLIPMTLLNGNSKERKLEILRLKEDLKVAEDGSQYDLFPKSASCKCYFFDKLGLLSPKRTGDGSDHRFSDVLRRRFLRQVRIKERKRRRTDDSLLHQISERDNENNVEQLSASVDFLLELCDTVSPQSLEEGNFKNWCHQAADFILGTLAAMSPTERNREPVEGIINSLIMRLLRRMCSALQRDESHHFGAAVQLYIQHLMRKVGNEAFVGQRLIFAVSERISAMAESLLFMDPFDDAFLSMNNSIYMMAFRRMGCINSPWKKSIGTTRKPEFSLCTVHRSCDRSCRQASGTVVISSEAKPTDS